MPMIVNTAWLLEYLEPKCSHEDLLDAFPRLGLEVEQTHELKKELDSIRIGFVRRKEPVAGAPGYHLCEIELERGRMIPVVCASEHEIREGWGVPVAPAGTVLADRAVDQVGAVPWGSVGRNDLSGWRAGHGGPQFGNAPFHRRVAAGCAAAGGGATSPNIFWN